ALKLLAPNIPVLINDQSLYPVWEVCERLGIPVLCHFGMLGAAGGVSYHPNISPAVLEPVARDFPTVDFVIPHFGIQHVTDLLFLCWSCPNVSVDSSGTNQWVRWMPYKLTLDDLFQRFYETIGPERILFGSDSSWFPRGFAIRYLQDQVRICRFMNMPHEHLQLIFGGNAARILNVPLGDIDAKKAGEQGEAGAREWALATDDLVTLGECEGPGAKRSSRRGGRGTERDRREAGYGCRSLAPRWVLRPSPSGEKRQRALAALRMTVLLGTRSASARLIQRGIAGQIEVGGPDISLP